MVEATVENNNFLVNYTALRKIWTHPKLLDGPKNTTDVAGKNNWTKKLLSDDEKKTLMSSNKFKLLFTIMQIWRDQRQKCLVFSEFVETLDAVEFFMKSGDQENFLSPWKNGKDYFRIDDSTTDTKRNDLITKFNKDKQVCVFLLTKRAGGIGINLTSANRVVLLDASWNPSNDRECPKSSFNCVL